MIYYYIAQNYHSVHHFTFSLPNVEVQLAFVSFECMRRVLIAHHVNFVK